MAAELPPQIQSDAPPAVEAPEAEAPAPHLGPTHPERPQRATSMGVVYFMLGFTLSAFLSMFLLMFLRPMLGEMSQGARVAAMLAPLGIGLLYGGRVAFVGVRGNLRLTAALKAAFGFRV